jgi:hypothetical protein
MEISSNFQKQFQKLINQEIKDSSFLSSILGLYQNLTIKHNSLNDLTYKEIKIEKITEYEILKKLFEIFQQKTIDEETFLNEVNHSIKNSFSQYLEKNIGECETTQILKLCTQEIIISILLFIKNELMKEKSEIKIRDSRAENGWQIYIKYTKDIKNKIIGCSVLHIRKERVLSEKLPEIETGFHLLWKVEIHLSVKDNFQTITAVNINLIETKYENKDNKKLFKNEEKRVRQLFQSIEEKKEKKLSLFQKLYMISTSEENDVEETYLKNEGIKKRRTLKALTTQGIMSYFDDVLIEIFSFIDFDTLSNKICLVNKIWNQTVWKSIKCFSITSNENPNHIGMLSTNSGWNKNLIQKNLNLLKINKVKSIETIIIKGNLHFTESDLIELLKFTNKKKIKKLVLNMNISDQTLKDIINKITNLEILYIEELSIESFTNNGLKIICENLPKLKELSLMSQFNLKKEG